jgi:hypothetical protein
MECCEREALCKARATMGFSGPMLAVSPTIRAALKGNA